MMNLIEKLEHFLKGNFTLLSLPIMNDYPITIQDEEARYTVLYVHHSYFSKFDEVIGDETIQLKKQDNIIYVTNPQNDVLFERYDTNPEELPIADHNIFVKWMIELLITDKEEKETILKEFEKFVEEELLENLYQQMFQVQIKQKQNIERDIIILHDKIVQNQQQIIEYNRQITAKHNELALSGDKFLEKLKEQLTKIYKHKKVVDVKIVGQRLEIYTTDLYFREPRTKTRYYLGKMVISLPFEMTTNKEITFRNINNARLGWWDDGTSITAHPHVTKKGTACFGNLDNAIADLYSRYEYFELYMLMLNFLQICNVVNDGAGRAAVAWDEVDENGNIIKEGHYEHAKWGEYFADVQYRETDGGHYGDILDPPEVVRAEPRPIPVAPTGVADALFEAIIGATDIMRHDIPVVPFGDTHIGARHDDALGAMVNGVFAMQDETQEEYEPEEGDEF